MHSAAVYDMTRCLSVTRWHQTRTHAHTHRRALPQYILRRLRLTQNVMSDADCTPGREPRSVAASIF